MSDRTHRLELDGDRVLEYIVDEGAPADAGLLVYHHGTPAAGPLSTAMTTAARAAGLRLVQLVRPGYGSSTRAQGRRVADVVPLTTALADHLGHARFVTVGWSGGGPHALATGALLPDRCAAVLSLASVAPVEAVGLNWLAGMGEDNWHEFGAALAGDWALEHFLTEAAAELAHVRGPDVVAALASLLPTADRAVLDGAVAEEMAGTLRFSVSTGIWGWFDDDMAFVAPWGFDLEALRVPVDIVQGSDDLMVPFDHGRWLAGRVPGAQVSLLDGEGHLSIVQHLGRGFAGLAAHLA